MLKFGIALCVAALLLSVYPVCAGGGNGGIGSGYKLDQDSQEFLHESLMTKGQGVKG